MTLTPEQKQAVSEWVAAGDNLSMIQKKLSEQFHVSMTYMDVRFLVDDLNLALKDPTPHTDTTDISKAPAAQQQPAPASQGEKKGFFEKAKEKLGFSGQSAEEQGAPEADAAEEDLADAIPPVGGAAKITLSVDKVTLIPGALASGTVTFSDGVTGKWIVDNYGRPGFTEISQKDYRPTPADAQAFMQELSHALQKQGY